MAELIMLYGAEAGALPIVAALPAKGFAGAGGGAR